MASSSQHPANSHDWIRWIIDLGPGAHDGRRVVFEGAPADLVTARGTLTQHLAAFVGGPAKPGPWPG